MANLDQPLPEYLDKSELWRGAPKRSEPAYWN